MKVANSTPAPPLNKQKLYPIAVLAAAIVTVATVALLFFVDKVIDSVVLQGGGSREVLLVLTTAAAGVFSLPYLLRIEVSPLMRVVSFVAMFMAVVGWLAVAWLFRGDIPGGYLAPLSVATMVSLSAWIIGLPAIALKK